MYFPSKRDIWLGSIIWGVIFLLIFINVSKGESVLWQDVLGYSVSGLTIIFLLWLWFSTGYRIESGMLIIRSGPFKSNIKIKEIKALRKTRNPISAPALSIDRIEILYGKYGVAIISPKHEAYFIKLLQTENPEIQLDESLK